VPVSNVVALRGVPWIVAESVAARRPVPDGVNVTLATKVPPGAMTYGNGDDGDIEKSPM
jgi:hypothetical protein